MKTYDSLMDALSDVKNRGYVNEFEMRSTYLLCRESNLRFAPELFTVDEVYRFEEDSDPDYSSILYLISSTSGVMGSVIDAYGVYAHQMTFNMARSLKFLTR